MDTAQPQRDQPLINIVGENVALGPLRRDLLPLYLKWVNDFEVTRATSLSMRLMTREAEEAWYEGASKDGRGGLHFTIYERASLRPIGDTNLVTIDHAHRTAGFGIMIGEQDCWGKGYGTETTALMLDYGFNALGLHNIWLSVLSENERGPRAYARAGFREIGRRREAWRLGGRVSDVVYMDCLATEFQGPLIRRSVDSLPDPPPA